MFLLIFNEQHVPSREYNSAKDICKYPSFSKVGGNYPLDLKIIWSSDYELVTGMDFGSEMLSVDHADISKRDNGNNRNSILEIENKMAIIRSENVINFQLISVITRLFLGIFLTNKTSKFSAENTLSDSVHRKGEI
jgi:hypothetical protein